MTPAPPTNPEALREALATEISDLFVPQLNGLFLGYVLRQACAAMNVSTKFADAMLLRLAEHQLAALDAATAQAERTAGELAAAEAEKVQRTTPRPIAEYHEDFGFVTWWIFPVCEPAWIGSPNCSDWPGYHTHFTPHPELPALTEEPPHAEWGALRLRRTERLPQHRPR